MLNTNLINEVKEHIVDYYDSTAKCNVYESDDTVEINFTFNRFNIMMSFGLSNDDQVEIVINVSRYEDYSPCACATYPYSYEYEKEYIETVPQEDVLDTIDDILGQYDD